MRIRPFGKLFTLAVFTVICITFLLKTASCGGDMDTDTATNPASPSSDGILSIITTVSPTLDVREPDPGNNSAGSKTEHFFQQHSTWYEPIPADASVVANSAQYIDRVRRNSAFLSVAARRWTVPVFHAKADTRAITVRVSKTTLSGWNTVPIPPEALPDMNDQRCAGKYTDGHMVVVSADRHWAWDFYQASMCDGVWRAAWIRRWDLTANGVNQPYDGIGSCRVAKVPLLHGLITYNEVVNEGAINHAIAFATWANRPKSMGYYPTKYYYADGADTDPWANILGMRYQLDPAFNCETTGWNNFNKIVCRALQKYGMIFVENAGPENNAIYAENLVNKRVSWDGIITRPIPIPWDRMKIVEPVYPATSQKAAAAPGRSQP